MVQSSLLETGMAITIAGVVLMGFGRQTRTNKRMVFENEGAYLRQLGGGIAERIFGFVVEEESTLEVKIISIDGRCSYSIIQIPGPIGTPSLEQPFREWHFPRIWEGDSSKQRDFNTTIYKGVYGFRMTNENPAPTNISFQLSLTENKTRFPRFYNIGTQILVVGIPLVIASFFS